MSLNLKMPDIRELKPRITVFGVGGAGGNAVNNMIQAGLQGVEFVVANTDAQALTMSRAERIVQMGLAVTEGLGAGSMPEVGRAAAEEVIDELNDHLSGSHMVFITAGMGGGTGTGAAPVVARAAREMGILTVGVVTKPFHFEGQRRMRIADAGITELQKSVDTLIVIPNQNLFRIANERTTFADAFAMADQVLYSGVACITDLMVKEGLINLDFADVRSIMRGMGKAMMGTGEASGDKRAMQAAEAAIANPLLDETSMKGARGLLISITGGKDMTLFEVDEAATRIREEVDPDANIIMGATFDDALEGIVRVSVVATGIDQMLREDVTPTEARMAELARRMKEIGRAEPAPQPAPRPVQAAPVATAAPAPVARVAEPAPMPIPAHVPAQAAAPVAEPVLDMAAARAVLEARVEAAIALPDPMPVAKDPAVTIERVAPPAPTFTAPDPIAELEAAIAPAPTVEAAPAPKPYIPPMAERPVDPRVMPRMPRVEDFPPHAQKQMQPEAPRAAEADHRPMNLLRRLASGLTGRGEDETSQAAAPAPREPSFRVPMAAPPVAPTVAPPRMTREEQAARIAAAGGLDPTGRPAPRPRMAEEDQLEIPAFLRRQAN